MFSRWILRLAVSLREGLLLWPLPAQMSACQSGFTVQLFFYHHLGRTMKLHIRLGVYFASLRGIGKLVLLVRTTRRIFQNAPALRELCLEDYLEDVSFQGVSCKYWPSPSYVLNSLSNLLRGLSFRLLEAVQKDGLSVFGRMMSNALFFRDHASSATSSIHVERYNFRSHICYHKSYQVQYHICI